MPHPAGEFCRPDHPSPRFYSYSRNTQVRTPALKPAYPCAIPPHLSVKKPQNQNARLSYNLIQRHPLLRKPGLRHNAVPLRSSSKQSYHLQRPRARKPRCCSNTSATGRARFLKQYQQTIHQKSKHIAKPSHTAKGKIVAAPRLRMVFYSALSASPLRRRWRRRRWGGRGARQRGRRCKPS